nr:MAG TPA: hypothetical protein [Caudoviricetes sp.]
MSSQHSLSIYYKYLLHRYIKTLKTSFFYC